MSFKRDGDDENLLKNLNHQRVKELLGSHIPEDEAKLLSNGRLACMICLHRPVFDTINMLSMHRRGKKHLLELSKYIKCQEDSVVREMQRKRPHSEKMTQPSLATTLGTKHVAKSTLRHRRRPTLEIQPMLTVKVPVLSDPDQSDIKYASATVRHYLKSMSRKSSLDKIVEKNRENYGIDLQKPTLKEKKRCPADMNEKPRIPHSLAKSEAQTDSSNRESEDNEIKLRMGGWIKDSVGKWVKDPNVEFDSDEDDDIPADPT